MKLSNLIPSDLSEEILTLLDKSELSRERTHAENTLKWVIKLKPSASLALRIAALAHDIERSDPHRYKENNFKSHEEYKKAHSEKGAMLLKTILRKHGIDKNIIDNATNLVQLHEIGGNEEADILKDADSISFFDNNLDFYVSYKGLEGAIKQVEYKFQRCSSRAQKYIENLKKYKSFKKQIARVRVNKL
jgi:hypothetical protein